MNVPKSRSEARDRIIALVAGFKQNRAAYSRPGSAYNETQVRTDFISPFLEALGWDVYNRNLQPLDLREVFEEATVEVGEEKQSKKPDYELRVARQRKFFVEAKKPSVNIERDLSPSFQTRRYGFSASLPISVLTNFNQLAIYDCEPAPSITDQPTIARLKLYSFEQYESHFDEIYDQISREAVLSGLFDTTFKVGLSRQGNNQFDGHFLKQVRAWREKLARDIIQRNPTLAVKELTFAVHLFLCRIVFLRICEDREIEKYETLKSLVGSNVYSSLMQLIENADRFYDSGIFSLFTDNRLKIDIGNDTLGEIIAELYYPQSPYTFAVVEASVLGEIYEQFLGEVITIDGAKNVSIVEKPEVRESGGVVPTPRYIVEAILDRSLAPALMGKCPDDLKCFTVADICCGSGIFLLGAYELLMHFHADWYSKNSPEKHIGTKIYEVGPNQWRLTFAEKRRILLQSIRGVDIDADAVEVAKFSLLLKLVEDETAESLKAFVMATNGPALPSLDNILQHGNSLVNFSEFNQFSDSSNPTVLESVCPLDWRSGFPDEFNGGGFSVIVGNPPYIRIQHMASYTPEEVEFYKSDKAPYKTARSDNFDKYSLFLERSLALLSPSGRMGVIVPHKFMTTTAGASVREHLTNPNDLTGIVHFGAQRVFGTALNYTCILNVAKGQESDVVVELVRDLKRWRYGEKGDLRSYPRSHFGKTPWSIAEPDAQFIIDELENRHNLRLGDVADIFVGVQTSKDDIFIVAPDSTSDKFVAFSKDGKQWRIEREILRPCLHDVQLTAYESPQANKFMIFPYRIGKKAELIQPSEMKSTFPLAFKYLEAYKAELSQRSITGGTEGNRQFYQFGRSQSLSKFNSPKIILPILSREPRYVYDDTNIVVTGGGNGPYYLLRPKANSAFSIFYLLAVLCHPMSEARIRTRTSVFQGGYYSHGKQFIERLPIPEVDVAKMTRIDGFVRSLIDTLNSTRRAGTPTLNRQFLRLATSTRQQIEDVITELFGLSSDDYQMIKDIPIPS